MLSYITGDITGNYSRNYLVLALPVVFKPYTYLYNPVRSEESMSTDRRPQVFRVLLDVDTTPLVSLLFTLALPFLFEPPAGTVVAGDLPPLVSLRMSLSF